MIDYIGLDADASREFSNCWDRFFRPGEGFRFPTACREGVPRGVAGRREPSSGAADDYMLGRGMTASFRGSTKRLDSVIWCLQARYLAPTEAPPEALPCASLRRRADPAFPGPWELAGSGAERRAPSPHSRPCITTHPARRLLGAWSDVFELPGNHPSLDLYRGLHYPTPQFVQKCTKSVS